MARDPLPLLLGAYEEFGPIFSMRLLHIRSIFMLGPEANHFVTVGHPENFHWRESSFGDLIPLLGDGLLTIDDAYHDRARAIMLPAFHREQVEASTAAMQRRGGGGDRRAAARHRGRRLRLDAPAWRCGSRCGRCSASTPTTAARARSAADHFEAALGFFGIDYALRLLRGPGSPWRRLMALACGPRRGSSTRRSAAAAPPPTAAAATSSACWSRRAARAASASPTPRSATR